MKLNKNDMHVLPTLILKKMSSHNFKSKQISKVYTKNNFTFFWPAECMREFIEGFVYFTQFSHLLR